jgi:hypothetical protein
MLQQLKLFQSFDIISTRHPALDFGSGRDQPMSLEMHVFLNKGKIPDRSSWQATVGSLGLPFELDPALDPIHDSGFSPSKIKGLNSGFEIYSEPAQGLLETQSELAGNVGDRDWCISFRWGGDMNECACVLAATAALVQLCDAVAYYPDDNLICDLNGLLEEAKGCL